MDLKVWDPSLRVMGGCSLDKHIVIHSVHLSVASSNESLEAKFSNPFCFRRQQFNLINPGTFLQNSTPLTNSIRIHPYRRKLLATEVYVLIINRPEAESVHQKQHFRVGCQPPSGTHVQLTFAYNILLAITLLAVLYERSPGGPLPPVEIY